MSEANTPDNPPLLEENDLNPAETKVLKAFREGWEAGERLIIVHPDGIESIKELATKGEFTAKEPVAEDWQGAILRASFLRSLFLGSYDNFAPRLVTICCARIEGSLSLDYCESLFPLRFLWCIFSEEISLGAAAIPELALTKCLIGQADQPSRLYAPQVKVTTSVGLADQFRVFGEVDLSGADIGGQLICNSGHFEKGLKAHSLKARGGVFLGKGFESKGEINLSGADIGLQLSCDGGYFGEGLKAQSMKTGAGVFLIKAQSNGVVDLSGAIIGGELDCNGGYFKEGLKAYDLNTHGRVSLSKKFESKGKVTLSKKFESKGKVTLSGANIGGTLACFGGYFEKGLTAQSMRTGESVYLSKEFESKGEVALNGAVIGGQLHCADGHFGEGLTAQNMKTGASVFLTEGFVSNGMVDLNGADIGGQLVCAGSDLKGGLNAREEGSLQAQNLKTSEDVFLIGVESSGMVALNGANIGGALACFGGRFEKGLSAQNLKTGAGMILSQGFESNGEVLLLGANIGGEFYCDGDYFKKGLIADGLHYQNIRLGGDWEKGLAWLSKMPESREEFFPQPYEQLMTVYRRMGKPDWAREIGFVLEEKRHKRSKGLWRAWYSILKWTIGYGYKPFRFLRWAIGLPLVGAILFSGGAQNLSSKFTASGCVPAFLANEWIPSEGEAHEYWRQKGQAPQGYPEFNPFIYSVEATFPVLPFGQLDKWHSDNTLFRVVRWVWTFTGSALLAILALFGVGTLGPNWKREDDGG